MPNKTKAGSVFAHRPAEVETSLSTSKFTLKSTATKAQLIRLAGKLNVRPHHTIELRQFGIHHVAGRIQDLEARGYVIEVSRITVVDAEGFTHPGVALYSLVSEPEVTL